MKALSLWQPWASLMACGVKRVETRGWKMSYRGPLVICATAKTPTWVFRDLPQTPDGQYISQCLGETDWRLLPTGAALCIVEVVGCKATSYLVRQLPGRELAFGNYTPGRYGILTSRCRTLDPPIPCKGHQGLFEIPMPDEIINA